MKNKPIGIIRISGLQQQSRVLIYNNIKEAKKYFSYILHDNHSYTKSEAQLSAGSLEIGDTFIAGDTTYWLSNITDTRDL